MSEQKLYNPHDHLVKIRSKDGAQKDYYPAAWRLYELTLRYPNANFSSEIILLDVERNLVVVKCRLYLGASYEQSDKKTEALKSGPLSTLDKVETAAKARCARDFGISTELALEWDEDAVPSAATNDTEELHAIMAEARMLKLATDTPSWHQWKLSVLRYQVANKALKAGELKLLRDAIEDYKLARVSGAA